MQSVYLKQVRPHRPKFFLDPDFFAIPGISKGRTDTINGTSRLSLFLSYILCPVEAWYTLRLAGACTR